MKKHTIGDWLQNAWLRHKESVALRWKNQDHWEARSWQDYVRMVTKVSDLLDQLNVKSNAHVGLISNTSVQWSICDVATIASGRVLVPPVSYTHLDVYKRQI